MPANSRWDLIRGLKVNEDMPQGIPVVPDADELFPAFLKCQEL